MSFQGNYDAALRRIVALEQERDDYILKQKTWEEANDELRSAHIELLRQRDALTADAERYRFLRNRTWVEAYWIDGAGGVDTKVRVTGCVDHLDKAVDMERIKEPRSQSDAGDEHK